MNVAPSCSWALTLEPFQSFTVWCRRYQLSNTVVTIAIDAIYISLLVNESPYCLVIAYHNARPVDYRVLPKVRPLEHSQTLLNTGYGFKFGDSSCVDWLTSSYFKIKPLKQTVSSSWSCLVFRAIGTQFSMAWSTLCRSVLWTPISMPHCDSGFRLRL